MILREEEEDLMRVEREEAESLKKMKEEGENLNMNQIQMTEVIPEKVLEEEKDTTQEIPIEEVGLGTMIDQQVEEVLGNKEEEAEMTGQRLQEEEMGPMRREEEIVPMTTEEEIVLMRTEEEIIHVRTEEEIPMRIEDSQSHQKDPNMRQDQIQEVDFKMKTDQNQEKEFRIGTDQTQGKGHKMMKDQKERKENVKYAVSGIVTESAPFIHLVKGPADLVEIVEDYIVNLFARKEP